MANTKKGQLLAFIDSKYTPTILGPESSWLAVILCRVSSVFKGLYVTDRYPRSNLSAAKERQ